MKKTLSIWLLAASLSTGAYAQSTGMDSRQPVEINADTLEVRQQENIAIFTGNVIAVQGDTKLKSDQMIVHYRKKSGDSGAAATDAMQGAVERIDVNGNVLLSTPEETASGDKGVYQVSKKLVHLNDNVVLTRGKNILKGNALVYDFTTGKSVINGPAVKSGQTSGTSSGRVRALFVPDDANKKQ